MAARRNYLEFMSLTEADAVMLAMRLECRYLQEFFKLTAVRLEPATATPAGMREPDVIRLTTLRGYFSRTYAWLSTISELEGAAHVQALTVAARSLFEATIDMVLIRHDPTHCSVEKMYAWERSAALRHAEKVQNFFAGQPIPAEYAPIPAFLTGPEPPTIRASRTVWPSGKHPARWTGRDLGQDAREAERLLPGERLLEFYELSFGPACWTTHGSSLAGLRADRPDFLPAVCAVALSQVHSFAATILRLIMAELGFDIAAEYGSFMSEARMSHPG